MCSVVTVVLVIQLVGEAGLFELAVLSAGPVLGVLLGGVPRLGANPGTFGIPTRDIAPAALVTMVIRTPAALVVMSSTARETDAVIAEECLRLPCVC